MKKCAVYIPAKGTSASVPHKNLAAVGGRPLVQITIDFAFSLGEVINHVIVSSEDSDISSFAGKCGAEVWERPVELSSPTVPVREVLRHDAGRLIELLGPDGIVVVLLPTSPFRSRDSVTKAIELLKKDDSASSIVSVSQYSAPVSYRLSLSSDGSNLIFPEGDDVFNSRSRRQQHQPSFYPDGAVYAVRIKNFAEDPRFFIDGKTLGIMSDHISKFDIDSIEDLELARLIAVKIGKGNKGD